MNNSIYLKENPCANMARPCGRSVNVFYRHGEEYLFDHFDFSKFKGASEYIFYELARRFKDPSIAGEFSYKGVELLSCFKLLLYNYASYSAILVSALINFVKANPQGTIYIAGEDTDWETPFIHQILQACAPEVQNRVSVMNIVPENMVKMKSAGIGSSLKAFLKDHAWPKEASLCYGRPEIVLFSDYQRIKSLIPLLHSSTVFFTDFKSPKIFIRSLIDRVSFCQISDMHGDRKLYGDIVNNMNKRIHGSDIFKDMTVEGIGLGTILKQKMGQLLLTQAPDLLCKIDKIHEFFARHPSIKTALLDEDVTPAKNAFCKVAKDHSVSTHVECHGALGGAQSFLPLTADLFFAWGIEQRDTLVRWGCPSEKIIISGCSRYNQYKKIPDFDVRKQIFRKIRFSEGMKTVLFVPHQRYASRSPVEKNIFEGNKKILDIILGYSGIQVIIKLHPGDNSLGYYKARCKESDVKCRVKVMKRFDPYLLIKSSDFMIVHDSTMAVDGFVLGRNVIFFPVVGARSDTINSTISDFEKYNVFYCPSDMKDFKKRFDLLLKDSGSRPERSRWDEARRNCINADEPLPEETISRYLLGSL